MRDHVVILVNGISDELQRLTVALETPDDFDPIVSAMLDLTDRLADERAWLRSQPLSSLLDPEAYLTMNRYRMFVSRAHVQVEHFLLTQDGADAEACLETLVELSQGIQYLDLIPES